MSATIEERVVAMKFDNSNFEKNVATSMTTLDKLKNALNFNSAKDSVKTLNEATKSVDFSKMADSIDTISDRFSALGVVGMSVLSNLTNKATDAALDILGKVPGMIIQGGWKRATDVEQARFTLQGVVGDAEEVKKIMDDASDSVSGTAYAYNEAAKAASVFAASGLRSGEQMQQVLKAVAGTAATANADYEGIAHLFQTIAGQGKVMGEQLNQFANRGINAAATLANYYGVTEQEIREMVSDGEVSFELFAEAMSETFGDHAKDANKTFSGSMANIRAALARTGEAFFKHIVEEEGPAVQLFNSIRVKINEMNDAWGPAAASAAEAVNKIISSLGNLVDNIPILNITNIILNAFKTLGNVLRPFIQIITSIGNAFVQAFDFGRTTDMIYRLSNQIEQFTRGLALSEDTIKGITKLFKGFFDIIAAVGDIIFEFIGNLKIAEVPFQSFTDIIGSFLYRVGVALSTIASMIKSSESLRYVFSKLSDTFHRFGETIASAFKGIAEIFKNISKNSMLAGYNIGSFIGSLAVGVLKTFATILEKIIKLLDKFARVIVVPALETFAKLIGAAVVSLQEFFTNLKKSERIQSAFKSIASAMERLFLAVKEVFKPLGDMFASFHDNADKATDSVGSFLGSLAIDAVTLFAEALAKVIGFLEKLGELFIIPALETFVGWIEKGAQALSDFASTHLFTDFLSEIESKLSSVKDAFKNFFGGLNNDGGLIENATSGFKKMLDDFLMLQGGVSAHTLYDEYSEDVEDFSDSLEYAQNEATNLQTAYDSGSESLENFGETIETVDKKKTVIERLQEAFINIGKFAKAGLNAAWDAIKIFMEKVLQIDPTKVIGNIKDALGHLKDKLGDIIDKFKTWGNNTAETTNGIRTPFEKATTAIKNFFKQIDTDKLVAIVFTGVMIGLLIAIIRIANAFTSLIWTVNDTVGTFKNIFSLFKNRNKSKIEEVAIAIFLIAASLALLAKVDSDKLGKVTLLLAGIAGAMILFSAIFTGFGLLIKGLKLAPELATLSKMLLALSVSVGILAIAIRMLEGVDFKSAEKAVFIIAELGLIMVGLTALLSRFSKASVKGFLTMIAFAVVIGAFAKALQKIANIDFNNVQNNLEGVALMFGGIALVAFAASNMRLTAALGLLAFVYVLQKVIPILKDIVNEFPDFSGIMQKIRDNKDVAIALGGFIAAIIIISGLLGKGIYKFGWGMLALSASIIVMSKAIKLIGDIPNDSLEKGTKAMMKILGMFALIALVLKIGNSANGAVKIALAISAMVLALYPLAGVTYILGSMNRSKVEQGVGAVAVILGMFALIIKASRSGYGSTKVSSIVALVAAVVLLMGELIVLTFIPYEQILASAGGMAAVLLSFAYMLDTVGQMDKIPLSVFAAIFIMAGVMAEIAVILWKLSSYSWQSMLAAAGGISLVLLSLAGSLRIMGEHDWKKGAGQALDIFLLSLSLYPIAGAIWLLRGLDWSSMVAAGAGFGVVLLALAKSVDIMNEADWKSGVGHALDVFLLSLSLYPIAGAIWLLRNVKWDTMIASAVAFGIVLLALAKSVDIMKDVDWKHGLAGAVSALILSVACIPIAYAISMLAGYEWQGLLAAATALSEVLLVMAGVTWIASKIGTGAGYAILGALGIVAVIAILELGMIALAALTNAIMTEWGDYIIKGLDYMILIAGKLGEAIGAFIGGIIGTAGMTILIDIGYGLSMFSILTEPFVDWLRTIDDTVIDGAKKLASALIVFGGAEFIGAIASFVGLPGLLTLPAQMLLMGQGLSAFSSAVQEIGGIESVNAALDIAERLFGIHLPNQGGIVSWFAGDNKMEYFNGDSMGKDGFGGGIKAFAEAVEGTKIAQVKGGIAVAEALFNLDPPNQGGIVSWFEGDNKISYFNSKSLGNNRNGTGFGGGIKAFAEAVKDIKPSDANGGITIAKKLFELDPPNEGGIVSWFEGDNKLKYFNANNLGASSDGEGFGGGLKAFADAVKGIKANDANGGITVAKKLFELDPPNEGGLISWIIGDNTFDNFNTSRLGEDGLGGGIKAFIEQVKDFDESAINGAYYSAKALEILMKIKIPKNESGFLEFIKKLAGDNSTGYEKFNDVMVNLGKGIHYYYNEIADIDSDAISLVTDALKNIMTVLSKMGKFNNKKIEAFTSAMESAGDSGIKAFSNSIINSGEKLDSAFETFMSKIVSSINKKKKTATDEMGSFADEMVSIYSSKTEEYSASGFNNSDSYIKGFMSNQDLANFNMEEFANSNYESLTGVNGFDMNGDYSNMFGDLGQINYDSYMDQFMSNQDLANFNMEEFAQENIGALAGANGFDIRNGVSAVLNNVGLSGANSVMDGINSIASQANLNNLGDNAQVVANRIQNGISNKLNYDNMQSMARNVIDGLADGLSTYSHIAEQRAQDLASKIAEKFARYNEINSPSKLYARFGRYIDEGLGGGIENYSYAPIDAVSSMSDKMSSAILDASDYISENMDVNPTVTPYVDITGAMKDVQALNSAFDDTIIAMDMRAKFSDMGLFGDQNVDATNSDVVSAIQTLRGDVSNIMRVVGNLKVMMDTGALVGAIAPTMDDALGTMAAYQERGM